MNVKKTLGLFGLQVKKQSPAIFLGLGIVGFGGTVYLTIKSKKKVDIILKEAEDYALESGKELTKDEKIKLATDISIAVAPPVLVGIASVGCVMASYGIMNKRLAIISGALAATSDQFRDYRSRVTDKYGSDAEYEIRNKFKKETSTELNEKGKEVITETELFAEDLALDGYRFFFDRSCNPFVPGDTQYNEMFVDSVEKLMNSRLSAKGFVFLNDVLEALGIDKVPAGQLVGWVDNGGYIDFGMYKKENPSANRFYKNDRQEAMLLDFNVQGPMYNMI